MPGFNRVDLLPTGSNTNQTSAGKAPQPDEADFLAFRIVCEAIGATPAISWQIQGSLDEPNVPDASSLWDNIGYVTEASDAVAFTARVGPIVANTAQTIFPSSALRTYRKYRVVISGILNVTYRVELLGTDRD